MYFDVIQASLGASRRTPEKVELDVLPPRVENNTKYAHGLASWSQARAVWVLFMILRGER